MPIEKGQRLKLLKIWEILRQETDEAHPMSSVALLQRLEEIDIKCDRRTLYADIYGQYWWLSTQSLHRSSWIFSCYILYGAKTTAALNDSLFFSVQAYSL